MFKNIHRLDDIPFEYFLGKDRSRFCCSLASAIKFLHTYMRGDELNGQERVDTDKLIHLVLNLSGLCKEVSSEALLTATQHKCLVTDEQDSGVLAATHILKCFSLPMHLSSRKDCEALQRVIFQVGFRMLQRHSIDIG